MSTISELWAKLASRPRREAFVESQLTVGLPLQIRALRKGKGLTQKQLAERTEMLQPRIAALENLGYEGFTLKTLRRVAAALDVGLVVRFVPFSEMVAWREMFNADTFVVPSYAEDTVPISSGTLQERAQTASQEQPAYRIEATVIGRQEQRPAPFMQTASVTAAKISETPKRAA